MLFWRPAIASRSLSKCLQTAMTTHRADFVPCSRSPVPSTSSPAGSGPLSRVSTPTEILVIESSEDERDTILAAHRNIAKPNLKSSNVLYSPSLPKRKDKQVIEDVHDSDNTDLCEKKKSDDAVRMDTAFSSFSVEHPSTTRSEEHTSVTSTSTKNGSVNSPEDAQNFANSLSKFRFTNNKTRSLSSSSRSTPQTSHPITAIRRTQSDLLSSSSSADKSVSTSTAPMTNCLPNHILEVLKTCPVCKLSWTVKKIVKTKRSHILSCFKKSRVNIVSNPNIASTSTSHKRNQDENLLKSLLEQTIRLQARELQKIEDTTYDSNTSLKSNSSRSEETLMGITLASRNLTVCALGVDDPTGSTSTQDLQKHIDDRKRKEKLENKKARRAYSNNSSRKRENYGKNISRYLSDTPSAEAVKLAKIIADFDSQRKSTSEESSEDILGISSAEYISCSPSRHRRKRPSAFMVVDEVDTLEDGNDQKHGTSTEVNESEIEFEQDFPLTQALPKSRFAPSQTIHQDTDSNDSVDYHSDANNISSSFIPNNGILEYFPSSNQQHHDIIDRRSATSMSSSSSRHGSYSIASNRSSGGTLWNLAGNTSIVRQSSVRRYSYSSSFSQKSSSSSKRSVTLLSDDVNIENSLQHDSSATKSSSRTKKTSKAKTVDKKKATPKNKKSDGDLDMDKEYNCNDNVSRSRKKPNYQEWSIVQLRDEVDKFGFRRSRTKAAMVAQLEEVWEALLNIDMEDLILDSLESELSLNEEIDGIKKKQPVKKKASKKAIKATTFFKKTKKKTTMGRKTISSLENGISDDSDEYEDEPDIDESSKSKITQQLLKAILSDEELHLRILRYEPIPLEYFEEFAKEKSIKISKVLLRQFLDAECVTYYNKLTSGRRR